MNPRGTGRLAGAMHAKRESAKNLGLPVHAGSCAAGRQNRRHVAHHPPCRPGRALRGLRHCLRRPGDEPDVRAAGGLFEAWEARQRVKGRSFKRRLAHGIGFEGGLVFLLVPVMAYWLETTLLKAFIADLGILALFFVYAIVFTWAFDKVFGLPQSAAPSPTSSTS